MVTALSVSAEGAVPEPHAQIEPMLAPSQDVELLCWNRLISHISMPKVFTMLPRW